MFVQLCMIMTIGTLFSFSFSIFSINWEIREEYIVLPHKRNIYEFINNCLIILLISMIPFVNLVFMLVTYFERERIKERTIADMLEKDIIIHKRK